jgi:hypothetical protein
VPTLNTATAVPGVSVSDPAHAWNALALVTDWTKHVEAKTAATLAAAGVTGGVLYNLIGIETHPGFWLGLASVICTAGVLASGVSAGLALRPRLVSRDEAIGPLFFDHIARRYPEPDAYLVALRQLTASPDDLVCEISRQVWVISQVAHRKYAWASYAMVCLLVALGALAWITVILGLRGMTG